MQHAEYLRLPLLLVAVDTTDLNNAKMQSTLTLRLEATSVAEMFRYLQL